VGVFWIEYLELLRLIRSFHNSPSLKFENLARDVHKCLSAREQEEQTYTANA
jgi:hypothetical protein